MMTRWKILWMLMASLVVGLIAFVFLTNWWVVKSTEGRIVTDFSLLKSHPMALVLGTSNKLHNGMANPFFNNRIKAAAELYHEGKVSHFILSGDNRTIYYNEPVEMKKALVKLGVPAENITLDFAGLRTLDSIVRCKEIFNQDSITIITQAFHCYRALFISHFYNIDAIAVATQDSEYQMPITVYVREYFARTKAVIDLYILHTAPRHLGAKELIKGV